MGLVFPLLSLLSYLWISSCANGAPMSPIMPPLPPPGMCQNDIDIVVLLDSSGSVQRTWNSSIDRLMKFIGNFEVSDQRTRFGIIEISKVAQVVSPLDSGNSIQTLYRLLEDLRFHPQNGQTFLGKGLQRAAEVFQGANPSRNVPKVLVTFTDGEPNEGDYAAWDSGLRDLSNQGVTLFVVAVRKQPDVKGIDALASRPSYLYIFDLDDSVGTGLYMKQSLASAVCTTTRPIPALGVNDGHDNRTDQILPPVAMPYSHDQPPPSVVATGGDSANAKQQPPAATQQVVMQGAASQGQAGVKPEPQGPVEIKPAPQGQVEIKPAPQGPVEMKLAPQGPVEIKPAPQGPVEIKPAPQGPVEIKPAPQGPVEIKPPQQSQEGKPLTIVQQVKPVSGQQQVEGQKPVQVGQQASNASQPAQGEQTPKPLFSQEQPHGGKVEKPQDSVPIGQTQNNAPQVVVASGAQTWVPNPDHAAPKTQEGTGPQNQGQSGLPIPEVGLDEVLSPNKTDNVSQEHSAFKCNLTLKFLNCKRDSKIVPRPLPVMLYESEKPVRLGDPGWKEFLPKFICDCANMARNKSGFKFWTIGIQNYHQCFSGPDEGRYDEDGDAPDGTCHDENGNFCTSSSESCAGDDGTNAVFTVITPEHKAVHRIEYD